MRFRGPAVAIEPFSAGMESTMKAIADLFSTDYGLFSISGILFMIGMAIWFYRFFNRKMEESERAQKAQH
jgi:hypothetical protein